MAQAETDSARKVRTIKGEQHFNKPIGSVLSDIPPAQPAPAASKVTPFRLRSIRAMIEDKQEMGDLGAVRALTEQFRQEYAEFSKGRTQAEVDQALNSPASPE